MGVARSVMSTILLLQPVPSASGAKALCVNVPEAGAGARGDQALGDRKTDALRSNGRDGNLVFEVDAFIGGTLIWIRPELYPHPADPVCWISADRLE